MQTEKQVFSRCRDIPATAGIGLRQPHHQAFADSKPGIDWVEVHSENYFEMNTPPFDFLLKVRENYALSLHGVGLSIGSTDPLNKSHLQQLKAIIDIFQPGLVSEHLCWVSENNVYLQDLLPLPQTEAAIKHVVERIDSVQNYLGRKILIENVSCYLNYPHNEMPEWVFLAEVAKRSGCGILLDVNNIYINAFNHKFSAWEYIENIPKQLVEEIHLAGHQQIQAGDETLLLDHHGDKVLDEVWQLYQKTLNLLGNIPTLIEWDTQLPELPVLLAEAEKANKYLKLNHEYAA
ncbi:DUF692 domain-containing protein [Spartinivicinus poritis]|uniref:UPF0276 protein ORQ98_04250 n=1 Tax=Spartinivicinus poritis TaxID=2994640 RepID=A0ABT5U469_9GAMM|nr:DUF692 domain-containing protein [Spartinivicinus sp. A2-2]MDE1461170.1 DUF692 domain-containing protein [Spartinivicinus sp. A2-2]